MVFRGGGGDEKGPQGHLNSNGGDTRTQLDLKTLSCSAEVCGAKGV